MGFTVEDKHLTKCLQVSSRSEYLISTSMECPIPHKYILRILYKSTHIPPRYKRKREWVFFFWTQCIVERKRYPDEIEIILVSALVRSVIDAARGELVFGVVDNFSVVEIRQYREQTSSVPVVRDAAAVIALTRQIGDCIVRHFFVFIDKHLPAT